jgi:DNA-binding NarL/FixJ family response regulator
MAEGSRHPKLRILLADDHPIVRDGLRLLVDAQPDMEVTGEAGDSRALLQSARARRPDVAVVDVAMPVAGGAKAAEALRRGCAEVKVLALSAHEEREHVDEMLAAGASGYVGKRAAPEELLEAIRRVALGETYLDPALGLAPPLETRVPDPASAPLSEREEGVLRLVASGYAMKEIASSLNVSVRTVETYRERGMQKAALRSRADLVRFAARRGWLAAALAGPVAAACPGPPRHTRDRS